ncbi:hypothetical protein [Aeromonas hydrophila]|uniref:hypothetical protein n=1 Tax=Aeromonas hydrophila TaxID=644 RepID=UPI002257D867|nr:hypothetical protein [Aeromonas hydrophila]MCX4117050.1 hypothetical protein [Aeromonas hydrophila]
MNRITFVCLFLHFINRPEIAMRPPLVALLQYHLQEKNLDVSLGGEVISLSEALSDTGLLPGLLLGVQQMWTAARLSADLGFDLHSDEQSMFGIRSELRPEKDFEQYYFRWAGLAHYLEIQPCHDNTISLDHAADLLEQHFEQTHNQQWSPT